jgi:asparagine synthase (glutamine-hydrolysing)
MCGIVGVFSTNGMQVISEDQLITMRDEMVSRGPDDAGILLIHENEMFLGFGHRRLSIIDLSEKGRQPMSTSDGNLCIVFNGEIFNFKEIREQLEQTGKYKFSSQSDTEVILYAIEEYGLEGCLMRIRGMYAFALFNKLDKSLTLVRDPLGVKPLYFISTKKYFAFASEIKALLAMPGVEKQLNEEALYHYMTFVNAPAPSTLFKGINKLEAGKYLKIDGKGGMEQIRYWDPTRFRPSNMHADERECVDELRRLLRQSVARRMVSDVPFGVFLSGGVDSSLNVALMAELLDRPVETFSIGIKGDPSNEFIYARKVAEHFGANHHEVLIDDNNFIDFLPQMAFIQDEPLADPVCVPLYYVSKLARQSGTPVIQVGEGSDEIFAGYKMYHLFKIWNQRLYKPYTMLPKSLKSFFYSISKQILPPHLEDAFRRAYECSPFFIGSAIAFWDSEKERLFKRPISKNTSSHFIKELSELLKVENPLLHIINVELKNRLPELLLMRVDKMSMANSIETRVPFLDEDLVEFALTIPSHLKFKNGESKYILKKAAENIIPEEIIYRKKWGFCGSATNMITEKIIAYAHEKIYSSPLVHEIFEQEYIDKIFGMRRFQKRFNNFKIWNLLNLCLWYECWF